MLKKNSSPLLGLFNQIELGIYETKTQAPFDLLFLLFKNVRALSTLLHAERLRYRLQSREPLAVWRAVVAQ